MFVSRSKTLIALFLTATLIASCGGSDTASRQRSTTFIPSTLDETWGTKGFSLMTQTESIQVADTISTQSGTTYSVGTMTTPSGPRAVVFRTVNGKTYDVKYAINPLKEKLAGLGSFSSSIGRKISVDSKGNVWVVFTATTSSATPTEHWAVTQLKSDLSYWGTETSNVCSSVCGAVYASSISIHDIQVNYSGDKVLVATSAGMDLFNAIAGLPLPLGTVPITLGTRANDCRKSATHLAVAGYDGFIAVSPVGFLNVSLVRFDGVIADCGSTYLDSSISGVHADGDTVTVFGKSGKNELSFESYYVLADLIYRETREYIRVDDIAGDSEIIAGQTVGSNNKMYGAFTVQGDTAETYLVEHDARAGTSNIFASLSSSTTGAMSSSQPPMLTISKAGLVLASSFTDASNKGTAIATRYSLNYAGLLAAPTFSAAEQNISVIYGQPNSVPYARAINATSYSLDSGSLPEGMSITSSGDLIGAPLSTGNYTARIKATNTAGSAQTVLYIRSAPKTPGSPTVIGVDYGSPVTLIGYTEGTKGSDKDVVTARFKKSDGTTMNQLCLQGTCMILNRDLPENRDVPVTLTQSNEAGVADSLNSIIVRRTVLPEPHTDVTVTGGTLSAIVSYTPSTNMRGVDALTTTATVTQSSDDSVVLTYSGCSPDSCELAGLPAGTDYVVTLTIVTEEGDVSSEPSAPFTVTEPPAGKKGPKLATENMTLLAREDFVLPLVATGTGDVTFEVNNEDLPYGTDFDTETNTITGSVVTGTYEIRYSASDRNGTTEGTVTIVATPSQLRAPGILPSFNTYDQKFSIYPFYERPSDRQSAREYEWTSTVTIDGKKSTATGTCLPGKKCTLGNAVWGQDLTLTMKALPMEDSEDTESDVNTFIVSVPELPPTVPTGKIRLERMPDINEQTAVIMGSVRMKPSMKFPMTLGAAATLQVDATTSCDIIQDQVVLRLEGPRNGCSVDPYIKLLAGDEIIANDDDSGAVQYPMGTDEDGFEVFGVYNSLSSRLSAMLEPGEYLIEATSYSDIFKDDVERAEESDVEYDLWITIITTPAEAERLMKNNIVGSSTNTTTELTVNVIPDPAKNDVIPADLQPAQSNNLPAPVQNSESPAQSGESPAQNGESAAESSGSVVSLTVEAGTGKVNVTPQTLGGGVKTSVTVKARPGGSECTTTSGDTCSINKLSPWISYTLSANVTGSPNLFTTTARPTLQWKAGAKVKVSSLGLSAAAKAMGLTLKKGGIRVSRNCTINAARTVITVGKSGSCWVTSRTTRTSKPKQSGPPLTATVTIK
jgi:hypothetical protein